MNVPNIRFALEYRARLIDRNDLLIPDVLIENFDNDLIQKLKPLFDIVWNSCGYPRSLNYDNEGNWNPQH